jgi:hypothetical protein
MSKSDRSRKRQKKSLLKRPLGKGVQKPVSGLEKSTQPTPEAAVASTIGECREPARLIDPDTGCGIAAIGNGFATKSLRFYASDRDPSEQYTKEEIKEISSSTTFDLPFRLTKFDIGYRSSPELEIHFHTQEKPIAIAAYNIGLPDFGGPIEQISIEPDCLGLAGFTSVVFTKPGIVKLNQENMKESLEFLTSAVNEFLDYYSLHNEEFAIRRISVADIVKVKHHYIRNKSEILYKNVFYLLNCQQLILAPSSKRADQDFTGKFKKYADLSQILKLAYRLYVQARRAMVRIDPPLAAIHASTAMEIALFQFIEASLRADPSKVVTITVKHRPKLVSINNLKPKDMMLDIALNQVFKQLVTLDVDLPQLVIDGCNKVRIARNDAVHKPSSLNPSTLDKELDDVRSLLDFIACNIP